MADRKAITDGTMSALGLATAAAIVFLAPLGATADTAAGQDGLVEASGSWTALEGDSAMDAQRIESKTDSQQANR